VASDPVRRPLCSVASLLRGWAAAQGLTIFNGSTIPKLASDFDNLFGPKSRPWLTSDLRL
jgi:hypothetical protein